MNDNENNLPNGDTTPDSDSQFAGFDDAGDVLPFDPFGDESWHPLIDAEAETSFVPEAESPITPLMADLPILDAESAQTEATETEAERLARLAAEEESRAHMEQFESLTVADAISRLVRKPRETLEDLSAVARTPIEADAPSLDPRRPAFLSRSNAPARRQPPGLTAPKREKSAPTVSVPAEKSSSTVPAREPGTIVLRVPVVSLELPSIPEPQAGTRLILIVQFVLRLIAFLLAFQGGQIVASAGIFGRDETFVAAAPFWLFAAILWGISELFETRPVFRAIAAQDEPDPDPAPRDTNIPRDGINSTGFRIVLGLIAVGLALLAIVGTQDNFVTMIGFFAWLGSMLMIAWAFAPSGWNPIRIVTGTIAWVRSIRIEFNWVTLALIAIMILAAFFRFSGMETPPEMTSDHVEKIINAHEILEGFPRVFFANNGGREPIQMYLLALLSEIPLPGLGINFYTLKLLSVIEGFLSIPIFYWLGRVVVGKVDKRFGIMVGLATAAFVAASYWHQTLSHLGLRIILTPAVASLLLIFLIKGLRTGSRAQFILAGLTLGIGLYTYQAVRMLPLVVIAGLLIGVLYHLRDRVQLSRLFVNGTALVVVSLICFAPMAGYISEAPEEFFQRTGTRILGDPEVQEVDDQGNLVMRPATFFERLTANVPQLMTNFGNALKSYNFRGDGLWFQAASYRPFMDAVTGAGLIIGLIAWVGLMIRKRDIAFDLWIPAILIMILPSALAIAFPNENPSSTRLSGSMPGVYLVAGFGIALLLRGAARVIAGKGGFIVGGVAAVGLVFTAYNANAKTYFVEYRDDYINSHYVYSEPGQILREFAESGNGWGNAFVIFYPYWWDHRAVAIEAGNIEWPHSIVGYGEEIRDGVPEWLRDAYRRTDEFHYDPNLPILFFYNNRDEETEELLLTWFPEGSIERHPTYQPNDSDPFRTYTIPPLGETRFFAWLAENGSPIEGSE